MSKNLEEMKVNELREMAKELEIKGRHKMNKTQLIDAINAKATIVDEEEPWITIEGEDGESAVSEEDCKDGSLGEEVIEQDILEDIQKSITEYEPIETIKPIDTLEVIEEVKVPVSVEEGITVTPERYANKERYIKDAKIGTLIAFRESDGSIDTAKVTNRNVKKELLKIQKINGKSLVINFTDILWVKSNHRWPKFIFTELRKKNANVKG